MQVSLDPSKQLLIKGWSASVPAVTSEALAREPRRQAARSLCIRMTIFVKRAPDRPPRAPMNAMGTTCRPSCQRPQTLIPCTPK